MTPMASMHRDNLEAFIARKMECILLPLLKDKGADYSTDGTIDYNFRTIASLIDHACGIDPTARGKYLAWCVYFMKHVLPIVQWCSIPLLKSEPIESRIADAINYLFLLWAMLDKGEAQP
jgi:hypothetical protein